MALVRHAAAEGAAPEPRGPASSGAPTERPAATVVDRVTLHDAWANAAGRPATGGMHDSVIPHDPHDHIAKFVNEKGIKIEDPHGIQDVRTGTVLAVGETDGEFHQDTRRPRVRVGRGYGLGRGSGSLGHVDRGEDPRKIPSNAVDTDVARHTAPHLEPR